MGIERIGIKLADGEFYPVIEDGKPAHKSLVLTTVRDGQKSVQIDLHRGAGDALEDTEYIGSLVVEGIPGMGKGEPDIDLELALNEDGSLNAVAREKSTGASQSLEVSLQALEEEAKYEIPDFEFSRDESSLEPGAELDLGREPEIGGGSLLDDDDFAGTDEIPSIAESEGLLGKAEAVRDAETKQPMDRRPFLIAGFAVLGVLVLLGLAWLVYTIALSGSTVANVPKPAAVTAPAPAPAPVPAPAPKPSSSPATTAAPAPSPAPAPQPAKAVAATPVAPAPRTPGVNYRIKWGDTLWDLSWAYYRNPWNWPKIWHANKFIKNPDYIISGWKIWIPPR